MPSIQIDQSGWLNGNIIKSDIEPIWSNITLWELQSAMHLPVLIAAKIISRVVLNKFLTLHLFLYQSQQMTSYQDMWSGVGGGIIKQLFTLVSFNIMIYLVRKVILGSASPHPISLSSPNKS